jgi:hypothetical protein
VHNTDIILNAAISGEHEPPAAQSLSLASSSSNHDVVLDGPPAHLVPFTRPRLRGKFGSASFPTWSSMCNHRSTAAVGLSLATSAVMASKLTV